MPNLFLPFLLKSDLENQHKIISVFFINYQKIITVSPQGDMIIWQIKDTVDSIDSKLYLTPSLNQAAGPLCALTAITKPLNYYTDGINSCILTIHRDNRIRMWNLDDGRCFQISQHNVFKSDIEITQIQVLEMMNSDSRLLFCIGRDKKLMIVDIWTNELIKSVEISKINLLSFKIDPEKLNIHFLNQDNEYSIWDIESYFKEEIHNYPKFIMSSLNNQNDLLKNSKETLKHRIRLVGSNQDSPLNFIFHPEFRFFLVLFSDRILIYKYDEVCTAKEKVRSYISLSFVNQQNLKDFYLICIKNNYYLLISSMTGNMTGLRLKDIDYLWDLQENANEELNFNFEDFSFFKNMSSNSAFLTIKSVNLIYSKDENIADYIKKQQQKYQYSFKLAANEHTTKTFLLLNPLEKTLTLFDLELELQKFKKKLKLLEIPKKKPSSKHNRFLTHKQSMVLSSGQKQLSLIANPEGDEPIEDFIQAELKKQDSNRNDSFLLGNKNMQGYLSVVVGGKKKNTIKEFLDSTFNSMFKDKFSKSLNKSSLQKILDDEQITFKLCSQIGTLLCLFLGTNYGNIYMFPSLFHNQWDYYPFYVYKCQEEIYKKPVRMLFIYKNFLFIELETGHLLTLETDFENESDETRIFFSKELPNKEFLETCESGLHEYNVKKWLVSSFSLDSNLLEFQKIQTLKFYDENGNQSIDNEQKYSFFKMNLAPLALISEENNVDIYSLQRKRIEMQLKGNDCKVLKVYLHPFLDEIITFNSKGYLYIYNIPTGVLDRILSIDNYSHLFNLNRYLPDNFNKYNVHSYKKFIENEEFQTSKYHSIMDYALRAEGYLLDYVIGKEFLLKKPEGIPNPTLSTNILNPNTQTAVQNPSIELSGVDSSNNLAFSNINSSNTNILSKQNIANNINLEIIDEVSSTANYEKKKNDSLNMINFARNGNFFLQVKKFEKDNAKEIANVLNLRNSFATCNNKEQGFCVLNFNQIGKNSDESMRQQRNPDLISPKKKINHDMGHVLLFDCKLNTRNLKVLIEKDLKSKSLKSYFSYLSLLFPWGIDKNFDDKVLIKISNQLPVFNYFYGIQGLGESFSFFMNLKERWSNGNYFNTLHALSILFFITCFEEKELKAFANYILQIIDAFSKKKVANEKNICMNLPLICKYFLDSEGDLMTSSYNLMISSLKNKNIDFNFVIQSPLELYKLTDLSKVKMDNFSYSKVIWILMIGYVSIFNEKTRKVAENCLKEIISLTNIKNCIRTPNYVAGCLKLVFDSSQILKTFTKDTLEFLEKLIYIYFIYYLSNEYKYKSSKESPENRSSAGSSRISLGTTSNPSPNDLKEIETQNIETRKTTKHIVSKAISVIGIMHIPEFLKILKENILNTNIHFLYPTAIIDIIRNFLKSQNPKQIHKYLHNFVEIILKTLDPNNPNLRKVCHKPSSQALHTIYKLYDMVSFHPNSQKFAIGTADDAIILYDLRTAVKWKVLEGHKGPIVCMNFDSPGKYLASFSMKDSSLRIWKIGTTGFFSSILGMQGKHFKMFEIDKKKYLNESLNTDHKFTLVWTEKLNHSNICLSIGEKIIDSFDIVD